MGLYTLQCAFNAYDVIILIGPLLMMYCYMLLVFFYQRYCLTNIY